jgi:gliding motility-associated-like protein
MKAYYFLKIVFLIFILFFSEKGFSQLSKKHYIPPLTSAQFGNANPEDQYIYLSTPNASNVSYTIIPIGQPITSYITGIVSNTSPQEIVLDSGNGQLFIPSNTTSEVINNKGYIIESETPVYVSIRMNAGGAQAGALVSKGRSALGTTFRVGSFTNENPQNNYLNFVSVMATEDNTSVTFSDLPSGLIIKNYSGATPINIILNEGESYSIATNSFDSTINRDGLIGCLVTSDKAIVVNCGSANGSFHNGQGRDYGIDQIAGLSKVGKEYIFVKGDGNDGWENVLIVAHSDNTSISINGNPPITTINAGEYYLIEGDMYNTNGNMYVETSEDIFAYQGIGATSSEANQGMFFVPPLSCETRGNINNIVDIDRIGNTVYSGGVTIVTRRDATVTINNLSLTNFSTIGPRDVDGNPDYVTYKITGLSGNISVQGDDELYVAYFNQNNAASSGGFYSGFPSAPEINFDAQFETLGNCIPNIILEAANTQNFDSFEWWFDDGTGFQNLFISTPTFTPTIPGKYKLIGIITCTLERLESIEVPVSICPDDRDSDGIIDNIDVDNDNDGILNCVESRGDVVVNITNLNTPELIFQDGSTNASIASGTYTQSNNSEDINTFSGTNTGSFTSTVNAATNGEGKFTMVYTELVNVRFSEDTTIEHTITNNESFIVAVLPVNKNITLIDPDDRLLIDSNFDGIFETGVTMISGSEIHFKINSSSTGNIPYTFFANQVDGFSFTHKSANISNASTFNGIISLTCFKNDNDADGIKDDFDLDSDNDGIPDFIENSGTLLSLSGVDTDFNGLDDVYNILSLPIDSDNDTVIDIYDLDSDNDGITDLIESGQLGLLSDTDLNGIVDSGCSLGINGWDDNAEAAPDNNLLGYILNDLDTDTIFSYIDPDSDGDECSDVIEAGFSDANGDNYLGDNNVVVDLIADSINGQGLVTNAADGYTLPNNDYLNFAPLSIITQPTNTKVCESSTNTISVISPEAETYQWEVSADRINWVLIVDNAIYNGSQTTTLTLTDIPLSFHSYQYRVNLNRNGNVCGLYSDQVELTVNPLPIVNSQVTLIQCDDDDLTTLGFSAFNLTEANNEISTNANNETFSYFLTLETAISGDITNSDYIGNLTTFINRTVSSDNVWARIESTLGCASVAEIQLNVSTTVIPSDFLVTFNQCDDFLDTNGINNANNDDRDGITTFDFSSVTATILGFIPTGQNPLPPRYYRNEADALAEENEITDISNYRNVGYPESQIIYIRIDSDIANDCLGLGAHIQLNVEALPIANTITLNRQCDDNNDGEFSFNTSQIESGLLGIQNPTDVTITYFDELGNLLPSPLPNPFLTASQTITIRITNNTTSAPDGPCYDEIVLEFIVDEQPIANPVAQQIVCDGDAGDIDDDGLYTFDTSTFESTIRGTQTGMDVLFNYIDENGNSINNSTSLPNPLISENQTILVEVINPLNTTCIASTNINLIVNPLPDFTVETPRIVCSSDPTFNIVLEPFEASVTETLDYQWHWTSLDGTITNQFVSNDRAIRVSNPGTYSITLTKTNGTTCIRTREIFVDASELATITEEDITIVDLSDNNSITIDSTNLGMGNYVYALSEENSPFIVYQDEPFFNNVSPGFYTIYVKDDICGVSTLDISVIGYPKYFTPNGDGTNDVWQIKGVSSIVQPNSIIYIFNRYGKLIKQLSVQSNGWDGTFNGSQLPTNDYWFKVSLQDGREFSGHFTLKR